MITIKILLFIFILALCKADFYFEKDNATKSVLAGLAEYRSALTLDWLAAEDMRQKELALAFETEPSPLAKVAPTDCMNYPRPASGKVARLMLELVKNLEGDEGTMLPELIQALVRAKLLVETSVLESEPDLDLLLKTPGVMMGEPHTTFPRILAMTWMAVTDPTMTRTYGWCPLKKINKYLRIHQPVGIANQMRALEPIVSRARFILEEFIQHVTPLNIYHRTTPKTKPPHMTMTDNIPNVQAVHAMRVTETSTMSAEDLLDEEEAVLEGSTIRLAAHSVYCSFFAVIILLNNFA